MMTSEKDQKLDSSKQMVAFRCRVIDWVMNLFVFFPSMLCYWRGIWDLYSHYFSAHSADGLESWYILAVGSFFVLAYFAYPLVDRLIAGLPVLPRAALVRFTLYCGGVLAMGYWRGLWGVLDHYLGSNWQSGVAGLCVSFPALHLLNSSRTVIFPPFVVSMDSRPDALVPSTRFETRLRPGCRNLVAYTLDSLFTHFVVVSLTIVTWRSTLLLVSLLPFDRELHDFVTFGVGIFAVVLLFALELPLAEIGRRLASEVPPAAGESGESGEPEVVVDVEVAVAVVGGQQQLGAASSAARVVQQGVERSGPSLFRRARETLTPTPGRRARVKLHLYESLVFLLVFGGEAFLWLGAWNLNSTYIVPDRMVGGWINHAFGSFLLVTLGLMSFGGFCGCGSDEPILLGLMFESRRGREAGGEGRRSEESPVYLYPNRYVRVILEESPSSSLSSSSSTSTDHIGRGFFLGQEGSAKDVS